MLKLDFLIPASATPAFFSQIAFFRLCLKDLGGLYADARLVAVFGDHNTEHIPPRWRRHFDGVEIEWAHIPGANNPMHRAQHDRRFEAIRSDANFAFLCDADVAPIRPFDELLRSLKEKPALAGVIAHYHFQSSDPEKDWTELADAVIGRPIERRYRYTLLGEDAPRCVPFYINYGLFVGPPDLLGQFHERDLQLRDDVDDLFGGFFSSQISLALTCADLQLPTRALPMRYNYPNDRTADGLYPHELGNVVFLHFLRRENFDRQRIFTSEEAFDSFIDLKLSGSDQVFQTHVLRITKGNYPFPG